MCPLTFLQNGFYSLEIFKIYFQLSKKGGNTFRNQWLFDAGDAFLANVKH